MYCILYIIEPICTLGCTGYWTVFYSTWSKPRSRRSNLLSQVLLWSSFYSLAGGNYWNRSFYGTLFKYFKGTEAEFKEFELRRWTAKNQLQQSAGSNIEKFKRNQFCLNRDSYLKFVKFGLWSRKSNFKWSSSWEVSCHCPIHIVTFSNYVRLRMNTILWFVLLNIHYFQL